MIKALRASEIAPGGREARLGMWVANNFGLLNDNVPRMLNALNVVHKVRRAARRHMPCPPACSSHALLPRRAHTTCTPPAHRPSQLRQLSALPLTSAPCLPAPGCCCCTCCRQVVGPKPLEIVSRWMNQVGTHRQRSTRTHQQHTHKSDAAPQCSFDCRLRPEHCSASALCASLARRRAAAQVAAQPAHCLARRAPLNAAAPLLPASPLPPPPL